MSAGSRAEMGIMAGIVATLVMSLTVIVVTAFGWLSIQWFSWVGSVFGATGISTSLAEQGLAWFVALGIIAGLIYAFAFKEHTVYQGLAFGGIAWFLMVLYLTFATAPQLAGPLNTLGITTSVELLIPLAVCFGLWGLAMGFIGARYAK